MQLKVYKCILFHINIALKENLLYNLNKKKGSDHYVIHETICQY